MKVLFILIFSALILAPSALALNMKNEDYILQMGNLNTAAGKSTGGSYKIGITVGQTAPGLFSGTNYKIRSGFQYIHSIIAFRFALSSTEIDFGLLSPTNPVTRTNTLTISNGSGHGYAVTASEDSPLKASNGIIPDTACDDGTCNQSLSSAWLSTLTYGFGYRCDNIASSLDCASGFSEPDTYKRFADRSKNEVPVAVMTGTNVGRNKQAQITYRINISGTQPAGEYRNTITYIATPTF